MEEYRNHQEWVWVYLREAYTSHKTRRAPGECINLSGSAAIHLPKADFKILLWVHTYTNFPQTYASNHIELHINDTPLKPTPQNTHPQVLLFTKSMER